MCKNIPNAKFIISFILIIFSLSISFTRLTYAQTHTQAYTQKTANPPVNTQNIKNTNKPDPQAIKDEDTALIATVILVKRQVCLDFMNLRTKTQNYQFSWQSPISPATLPYIGLFSNKVNGINGCGQIKLPIEARAQQPKPEFGPIVYNNNQNNQLGMLEILRQNFTKTIAAGGNLDQIDNKPFVQACMLYQNKIVKNPNIKEKLLTSFGVYLPQFPLELKTDDPVLKIYAANLNKVLQSVVNKGCDGTGRKNPDADLSKKDDGYGGLNQFAGLDGNPNSELNFAANLTAGTTAGLNDLTTAGTTAGSTDSDWPGYDASTGGSTGGSFGPYSPPAPPSGTTDSGSTTDTGTSTNTSTTTSTNTATTTGPTPPEPPPGTKSCPDGSPCTPSLGDPSNCICPSFSGNNITPGTFMSGYSPQSGFIYNLPNPGGEQFSREVEINGEKVMLEMSIPCYAANGCTAIHGTWKDYSQNRQLLFNQPLDTYSNNPDQLWIYPYGAWTDSYKKYYQDSQSNHLIPLGPMQN
ncbi:MAG: hypothetical protein KBD64_00115 [Gammaproteobacteria bacterium]|nr:hypothetical protein [Gammaproteobacteria bacterium]